MFQTNRMRNMWAAFPTHSNLTAYHLSLNPIHVRNLLFNFDVTGHYEKAISIGAPHGDSDWGEKIIKEIVVNLQVFEVGDSNSVSIFWIQTLGIPPIEAQIDSSHQFDIARFRLGDLVALGQLFAFRFCYLSRKVISGRSRGVCDWLLLKFSTCLLFDT